MSGWPTSRRQLLLSAVALVAARGLAAPAVARARTKIRLGHLHVVAVDGQICIGLDRGSFAKQGIDFELTAVDTGPEAFEALAAGKVDLISAGGVVADYLARGAGKLFLINDIEVATTQLWVRPDLGVKNFADLKGKRIATTRRTTAHIFLDRALSANNLASSEVEIVNQRMSDSVASFIAGEVPAVALWVPFNIIVRDKLPGAIKLVDASAYYPRLGDTPRVP
jgi:NitT/TauT family transport system substrate-binding protein